MGDEVPASERIRELRPHHDDLGLDETQCHPDPLIQFDRWMGEALAAGVEMPNAMTVATADRHGRPSARMVLLRDYGAQGFTFFTNYDSRKGRELAGNPHAALVFYWHSLERQVRVTGSVAKLSTEASEAYWRTRPRDSKVSAWASAQSEVVESRTELDAAVAATGDRFADGDIPLPPFWGGFLVAPEEIEFWQGRSGRLHDRIYYRRVPQVGWMIERLSP